MKKILLFIILTVNGVFYVYAQDYSTVISKVKSNFLEGKYEVALVECNQVLESLEKDSMQRAVVHSYAGLSYEKLGKYNEAIEHYKQAVLFQIPRLDIYDQLIALTRKNKNAENYEWALQEKLKAFPDFKTEISQSLAKHYMKTKQYEALHREAKELNALNSTNTSFLYYQAIACQNLNITEEAFVLYKEILEIDSIHIGANVGAGISLYKKGTKLFNKKKKAYEAKKSPSRVDYTNYLKSLDEAKAIYREALSYLLVAYNNGGKTSLKGAIANIYTRLGEKDNAAKYN